MKKPKTPNPNLAPSNRTFQPKPDAKSKPIISKPRSESQLESQPSYAELQYEIGALKEENLKLCKQIAKFKAENTTLKSQITILTEEYAKYHHDNPPFDTPLTEEQRQIVDEIKQSLLQKQRHKNENNLT